MKQFRMTIPDSESRRRNREQEEIEQNLLEALEEPPVPVGKDFWKEVRRTAHARARASCPPNSQ